MVYWIYMPKHLLPLLNLIMCLYTDQFFTAISWFWEYTCLPISDPCPGFDSKNKLVCIPSLSIILDYEYIYLHVYYSFAIILILPQIYQWRYILPYWWFELSCFLISWKFILILAGAFILLYAYICFPSTSNMFVNTVGASILSYMRISVSVLLQISLPMLAGAFVLSFMHTYAWSACV